jgi:hypothetical protein
MKQINKIMSTIWLLLGLTLVTLSFMGITDEFWSGMGSALLVIGSLQLLRYHRFQKNPAYREKMEVAVSDERNQFIRSKAWAWAGYLFILISAVGVFIFKLAGQDLLSQAASWAVCLMLVLYWICWTILQKKY